MSVNHNSLAYKMQAQPNKTFKVIVKGKCKIWALYWCGDKIGVTI